MGLIFWVSTELIRPPTGKMMKLLMGYPRVASGGVDGLGDGGNEPHIQTLLNDQPLS